MNDVLSRVLSIKTAEGLTQKLSRPSNRVIVLGDSISASGTNETTGDRRQSWYNIACVKSGQKSIYVRNSAIPGQITEQMLSRLQTDVIAYKPSYCFVMGGTNDIATGTGGIKAGITTQQTRANIEEICKTLRANNIEPILCTIPPRNADSSPAVVDVYRKTNAHNLWIKQYAATSGIQVIDFYKILVDPTNGNYKAGYSNDKIHPEFIALEKMGDLVVSEFITKLPAYAPYFTDDNTNPINLLQNGLFLDDSDADGKPDNWIAGGTGTATYSLVPNTTGNGNLAKINKTLSANTNSLSQTVTTGFDAGDRIYFAGKIKSGAVNSNLAYHVRLSFDGTSTVVKPLSDFRSGITDGAFQMEWVVPSGTAGITVTLELAFGVSDVSIGQMTLLNLTQLGL